MLNLYTPTLSPSPETKRLFNEAFTKSFTSSFESLTTDRKAVNTLGEFQLDTGSSSGINASLNSRIAYQKTQHIYPARTTNSPAELPDNRFINASFDNVSVKQHFVQTTL